MTRRGRAGRIALAACLLLAALFGCNTPERLRRADRYRQGVVLVLPGIEGKSIWNRDIAVGLDEGGVFSAIEIYDWTVGVPGIYNLVSYERNRREAQALADRIMDHRRAYPDTPLHLIGHSGGGGIAVLALEALPEGETVDLAILLAPALSPTYDLTEALGKTRHGIANFYSRYDVGFLGLGTTVFGSIDRDMGASAGAVGFRVPPGLSEEGRRLYADRLRQIAWNERLRRAGAYGGHFGWASKRFAREYLAPLIRRYNAIRPDE